MTDVQLSRLEILFRRTSSLPQLSSTVTRLLHAVDAEHTSACQIEKIISSDPPLAAKLLRLANSPWAGAYQQETASIAEAILRIGTRSIRAMALSLLMQSSLPPGAANLRVRYTKHSLYTAFVARYVFARTQSDLADDRWTVDEVFAVALLHDLAYPLLAHVDQATFVRAAACSRRAGCTVNAAFDRIFGAQLPVLAALACRSWQLPEAFSIVLENLHAPWERQDDFLPICCIAYADYLANARQYTIEDWPINAEVEPEIRDTVGLEEEEIQVLMPIVEAQVDGFLQVTEGASCRVA